ncbi:MAG: DUF4097 family beta strand repeat-containing protein, partial [Pyrinomonadaceae bacterium]
IVALCSSAQTQAACNDWGAEAGDIEARESSPAITVPVVVITTAPAPAAAARPEQDDFRWRGPVAAGRVIEIKGVNGDVRAETAAGGEVEVTATKSARRSDPAGVRIQVVEHADGVTICAVYPSGDSSRPNTCEPGSGGRSNVRNNDTRVDFTVRVPASVRFNGRTVNGGVEARALGSDVEAHTVNGGVRVSTAGLARASTVNGSITAIMGGANWAGALEFATVNGGIELELPSAASADVRAETVNGEISTDFPITVTGRFSKRNLTGTIGSGGRELRLKTVNGDVELRRTP